MSKLYIIGNGFDINHGLKSCYKDFLKYVCLYHHDEFHRIGKMFGTGNPSFLWKDFENNLACFDVNRSICLNLIPLVKQARLYPEMNLDIFTTLENACDGLYSDIGLLFKQWFEDRIVHMIVNPKYQLSPDDYYVSFNYTSLLESVYGIPSDHICYIHRNLFENDVTMPIFGHGLTDDTIAQRVKIDSKAKRIIGEARVNIEDVKETYITLIRDFRKNVKEGLDNLESFFGIFEGVSIDKLVILGHSIGDSDYKYFLKTANTIKPNSLIYYSYYNEDEKDLLFEKLNDLFSHSERIRGDRMENIITAL